MHFCDHETRKCCFTLGWMLELFLQTVLRVHNSVSCGLMCISSGSLRFGALLKSHFMRRWTLERERLTYLVFELVSEPQNVARVPLLFSLIDAKFIVSGGSWSKEHQSHLQNGNSYLTCGDLLPVWGIGYTVEDQLGSLGKIHIIKTAKLIRELQNQFTTTSGNSSLPLLNSTSFGFYFFLSTIHTVHWVRTSTYKGTDN